MRRFHTIVDRLPRQSVLLLLFLFGTCSALLFSFLLYPQVAGSIDNQLSADGHDRLGRGLYELGTLCFYPDREPTLLRGPVYPVVVAVANMFGREAVPTIIILLQSLFHGCTVLLASLLVKQLEASDGAPPDRFSLRAIVGGVGVALHPFLLWYIPRIVVEPLSVLLFTALALLTLKFAEKPTIRNGIVTGVVIGLAALTKGIALPYLLIIPGLLLFQHGRIPQHLPNRSRTLSIALITLTGMLVVAPWTVRNWTISNHFVPVHILDGVNFAVGDHFVEHWEESPLAYGPVINQFTYPAYEGSEFDMMSAPAGRTVEYDRMLRAASIRKYGEEPTFLLKKLGVQSVTFWTSGSRPIVTILIGGMQLLLLLATIWVTVVELRRSGWRSSYVLLALLILPYWLFHLPLYAIGRFSLVLVPTMIAIVAAGLKLRSKG